MTVILSFLALVALVSGWWLSRQGLAAKPWMETGLAPAGYRPPAARPGYLGVMVFVAVAGGLFAMLGSAFVMQIEETPWELVPLPPGVWLNTAVLLLGSLLMQIAAFGARGWALQGRGRGLMLASLAAATVASLAFLAGQFELWRLLTAQGYPLDGPPAAGFFYLITGLHGLHILGGMAALAVVWLGPQDPAKLARGTALCAAYWHALLVIWLVLFALLQGWGNAFLAICRSVIA